jgi:hypothetical protein
MAKKGKNKNKNKTIKVKGQPNWCLVSFGSPDCKKTRKEPSTMRMCQNQCHAAEMRFT